MPYDPSKHHRRSIRLKAYDYSQAGAYFVTVCVQDRECLFGEIASGEMQLSPYGQIVQFCWDDLVNHYPHVELDAFVIMPNHLHGIILLTEDPIRMAGSDETVNVRAGVGAGFKPAPTAPKRHDLSEIVRALKTFSARRINALRGTEGIKVWQRDYYEHIIRNEKEWNAIADYIHDNPANWMVDSDNPSMIGKRPVIQSTQGYLREAGL